MEKIVFKSKSHHKLWHYPNWVLSALLIFSPAILPFISKITLHQSVIVCLCLLFVPFGVFLLDYTLWIFFGVEEISIEDDFLKVIRHNRIFYKQRYAKLSDIKEIMPFNGYITKGIYLNEQLKVVLKNSGYFYCGIMKDKNELSKLKNSVIEQKNRI